MTSYRFVDMVLYGDEIYKLTKSLGVSPCSATFLLVLTASTQLITAALRLLPSEGLGSLDVTPPVLLFVVLLLRPMGQRRFIYRSCGSHGHVEDGTIVQESRGRGVQVRAVRDV
jgi:hypothetical protein